VGEFSDTLFNDKGNNSLFYKAKCPAFNDLPSVGMIYQLLLVIAEGSSVPPNQ
jgi:hypothetical protein